MTWAPATSPVDLDRFDHRLRMQLLVEMSEDIAEDPDPDVIAVIHERLSVHYGGTTSAELLTLLQAAAWRQPEAFADHVHDVYVRQQQVQAHGLVSGHDLCCGGECPCTGIASVDRCDDCDGRPNELLDEALRSLLVLLEQAVSERAVRDTIGVAS